MPTLFPPHPHVVVHGLDSPDRPEFASFVFDSCARPLPAWAINRVRSFEPNHNSDFIMEDHGERDAQDPSQLSDVADAIFLVVSRTRRLDARQHDFSPLLFFTVGACVKAVLKDAVLSDDIWVALRRVPLALADLGHLAPKYMLNPLLVLLPLPYAAMSTEEATPPAIPTPPLSDASTDSSSSEASDMDLSEWLARPCTTVLRTSEYVFDDGPPAPANDTMHQVITAAKPPRHFLSVLVVAACDEIYDAVSSALYQRLSWNVHTPIMGISFARDSDIVRILVAWLEHSAQDADELPRVHVLHAAPLALAGGAVSQGLFSLQDPNDSLVLARLLICLAKGFSRDRQESQLLDQNVLPRWRADQLPIQKALAIGWSDASVRQWASQTAQATDCIEIDVPSSVNSSKQSDSQSSCSAQSAQKRYTFDEFIALREIRNMEPTATALWMIDRQVRVHCFPPISRIYDEKGYTNLRSDLKPCIPFYIAYRSATQFSWPTGWTSMDALPAVPGSVAPLARQLFRSRHATTEPHQSPSASTPPEVTQRLETELPTVLHVCALARSLNGSSAAQRYKFCYDLLFTVLSPCSSAQAWSDVALRLSRNKYVDKIRAHSHEKAMSLARWRNTLHKASHFWEVDLFEDGDAPRAILKRVHFLLGLDVAAWPSSATAALKRTREAPLIGICDHVIVATAYFGSPHISSLIVGRTGRPTFPASLRPYWTTPENFFSPQQTSRSSIYDLFASSHYDYPSAPAEELEQEPFDSSLTTASAEEDRSANPLEKCTDMDNSIQRLVVPVLVVVHGLQRIRFNIADGNRLRLCLISTAEYLGFLGIFDFPVFGLLTEGTRSAVVMAWAARNGDDSPEVQFLCQHCCAYDISDPAGAFNLASFLLRLQLEHAPRLAAILDDPERRYYSQTKVDAQSGSLCAGWSMEDQIRDLKQTWSIADAKQFLGIASEPENREVSGTFRGGEAGGDGRVDTHEGSEEDHSD